MSLLFYYISVDEAAKIHEISIIPLRNFFGASGFFYLAWVIVAIPVILLLALLYYRFVFALPRSIRLQIIVAGGLYITGGLGMEMLAAYYRNKRLGQWDIVPFLITLEEFLENVGIVVFIFALTSYMKSFLEKKEISIEFV